MTAHVVGLPEIEFELWPMFTRDSAKVLWGREDFFMEFGVYIDEPGQQLTIFRPDAADDESELNEQ